MAAARRLISWSVCRASGEVVLNSAARRLHTSGSRVLLAPVGRDRAWAEIPGPNLAKRRTPPSEIFFLPRFDAKLAAANKENNTKKNKPTVVFLIKNTGTCVFLITKATNSATHGDRNMMQVVFFFSQRDAGVLNEQTNSLYAGN